MSRMVHSPVMGYPVRAYCWLVCYRMLRMIIVVTDT